MESKITEVYHKEPDERHNTDCSKVSEMLDLVIDGEATSEEERFFNTHLEECVSCFETHQKQKLLKGIISGHLKRVIVPESLALSIKARIQETL
ncbi:zf-HC2 domain-containing protein [uncultured Pontibacter sp.]|uniref:anti-sigma factor family protein n=1 Tax=uncultured Pontibacter sp. TaxID=453356 RepID=UPI002614394C|nr:zf-HC2 domain-containing protein [uncultured Pontibacter sp.]